MSNTERWPSAADRRQVQLIASTEPKGAVPMIAQLIVGIGMHEHVERSMIERKPTYDVGKLRRRKRDLVAPSWMGSDLSLVKAAHLHPIAKLRGHHFAKFPGGIATGRIEINMLMPARDTRHIEIRHSPPFARECPPARRRLLGVGVEVIRPILASLRTVPLVGRKCVDDGRLLGACRQG